MNNYPTYPSTKPFCRCMQNDEEDLEKKEQKNIENFEENKLKMVEEMNKNKDFDVKEFF